MAVFMYEGEEGRWQNRIDGFWVAVHDRTLQTQSRAVALLNRLAETVRWVLDRAFGTKLFSLQAVIGSITISTSLAALSYFATGRDLAASGILFRISSISFLLSLFLPFIFPNRVVRTFCFLPPLYLLLFVVRTVFKFHVPGAMLEPPQVFLSSAWLLALCLSIVSDVAAVYFIRKKLAVLAQAATTFPVIVAIAYLVNICVATCGLPLAVYLVRPHTRAELGGMFSPMKAFNLFVMSLSSSLFLLNVSSVLFTLMPAAVLAFVLLNRLFWPLIARLVYPLGRYAIVSNKAVLKAAGCAGIAIAFNLEKVGWDLLKDMLK
jgi:hypothetical protein